MFRTVCALTAFCGCTLLGMKASHDIKARLLFIKDFIHCMNVMKIRLEYDLPQCSILLFEVRAKAGTEEVRKLFDRVAEQIEANISMEQAWKTALSDVCRVAPYLKNDEKAAILRFGGILGSSHRQGQLLGIAAVAAELEQVASTISQTFASKTKFCRSLGAIAGIMLAIVIL